MVTGWRKAFCTSPTMPKNKENWECNEFTFPSTPPKCLSPNNSPSSYYSLLKATLRLSKSVCGICSKSVKTGEGKAILTAECCHTFHFPCIAAHVRNQQLITCPVCSTNWNDLQPEKTTEEINTARKLKTTKSFKLQNYNDDEPLLSPTSVSRFNTIPESDENEEDEEEEVELQGFSVKSSLKTKTFDAFLLPETATVASNRSFETIVAVLKVKAKPCNVVASRPPVDLVTVIDVGGSVSSEEIMNMKRSMQVVISSLGSADRLSVIAFSGSSKRLFPLRRMTGRGRRSARRVVEALAVNENTCDGARKEALKKAAKVLEDRRQKNPVAKIILLTNGYENRRLFSHHEFPVHELSYSHAIHDGAFKERIETLLRVVAQDLRLELRLTTAGEITSFYSPEEGFTAADSPCSVAVKDLHAAEERELLVELKVPSSSRGSHKNFLSVQSSHRDPFTQEIVNSKECATIVPRSRAVRLLQNEIQRLVMLHVSARASMKQSSVESAHAERRSPKLRRDNCLEEKVEPLTPMSAWRVAERLAKVAIIRKSMNKGYFWNNWDKKVPY